MGMTFPLGAYAIPIGAAPAWLPHLWTLSVRPWPAGRCGSLNAFQLDCSDATRYNFSLNDDLREKRFKQI